MVSLHHIQNYKSQLELKKCHIYGIIFLQKAKHILQKQS